MFTSSSLSGAGIRICGTAFLLLAGATMAWPATSGLGLQPGRLEIEVKPGVQKTVSFEIETPPSVEVVRGRLMLSLTDWNLTEEGSLTFQDAGSEKMSAAPFITFSPAAISIESGQRHLVRVTVNTPADAAPGVYRAGIFVQERPPAAPPKRGEHNVVFRFRYMETVYVIVTPVAARPSLVNSGVRLTGKQLDVICEMKNEGSGLVRPHVTWTLRDEQRRVVAEVKSRESTVLLPLATLSERYPLEDVPAGKYELSVAVDFHDDGPVQSMVRAVEIATAATPPSK